MHTISTMHLVLPPSADLHAYAYSICLLANTPDLINAWSACLLAYTLTRLFIAVSNAADIHLLNSDYLRILLTSYTLVGTHHTQGHCCHIHSTLTGSLFTKIATILCYGLHYIVGKKLGCC